MEKMGCNICDNCRIVLYGSDTSTINMEGYDFCSSECMKDYILKDTYEKNSDDYKDRKGRPSFDD